MSHDPPPGPGPYRGASPYGDVQPYGDAGRYPGPAPVRPRGRRILLAAVAAWALVLVGTGGWYALHGRPTVRDQTTIGSAQSTVDTAVADLLRAAGSGPVPVLSGFAKVGDCDVTLVRAGERWARSVRFWVPVDAVGPLIDQVAAGLPARYQAKANTSAGGAVHTLYADAGDYVSITGSVDRPGLVRFTAGTGCRPVGTRPAADPTGTPDAARRAPVDAALAALRTAAVSWRVHELRCGTGTVATVEATGGPGVSPDATPPVPAGAQPVLRTGGLAAWRAADGTGVASRTSDGTVVVAATTGGCAG